MAGAKTYRPKGTILETPSVDMMSIKIEIEGTMDIVILDEPDISLLQIATLISQDDLMQLIEPSIYLLSVENFMVEESEIIQQLIVPDIGIVPVWVDAEDVHTIKLKTPDIEIVTIGQDYTPAILGVAILGKAVLGKI